ncbi:transglycosylase SLT domain-containing protein [Desulfosarcina ovata]|nr:transglycosylase SLT domain-containing protein [Desulfosarcina ovata]
MKKNDLPMIKNGIYTTCILFIMLLGVGKLARASDPWKTLQERFDKAPPVVEQKAGVKRQDPWARLRKIYLPFSIEQETAALRGSKDARRISLYLTKTLERYGNLIEETSKRFEIPEEIIGAVIMVESGGNPEAEAGTSSAKGLMQTISGTFLAARQGLMAQGIHVENDPFNPRSSIFTGSWYLDKMYRQAAVDKRKDIGERHYIASWRYPLEYYYAGPAYGKKKDDLVIVYAGGREMVINKSAYSKKVLNWARLIRRAG